MTARPSLRPLRAAILLTGMGWIVAAIAVAVSVAVTGNFLFESAPAPGAPETVSTYFQVAAAAALLPVVLSALLLSGARLHALIRGRWR